MAETWSDVAAATRVVHAGLDPDPATGAVVPPLHLSSTFAQDRVGVPHAGYEYARSANPTRAAFETSLAALESPQAPALGLAFASGLAASDTLLRTVLRPGDHVVLADDVYGGTYRLLATSYRDWGVQVEQVNLSDLDAARAAVRPGRTRLVWVETPSNPTLSIADIAALAEIGHSAGAVVAVDNTFATPILQQPLALGADIVLHSATKYLGGHGDVMGGVLAFREDGAHAADCHDLRLLAGATASPFAAWMILRGVRTLPARMAWHCANAKQIAAALQAHPRVARVHYPGLPDHPQHAVAAAQMREFGGMLSFEVDGGEAAALAVAGRLRLFTSATSLGSTESLVEHRASIEGPTSTTPRGLLRLSVGLEHAQDLLDDLAQALDA